MESSIQQQRRVRPGGGLGKRLAACWSRWRRKVAHEVEVPWRSSDCGGPPGLCFLTLRLVPLPLPEIPPPNSRFRLPVSFFLVPFLALPKFLSAIFSVFCSLYSPQPPSLFFSLSLAESSPVFFLLLCFSFSLFPFASSPFSVFSFFAVHPLFLARSLCLKILTSFSSLFPFLRFSLHPDSAAPLFSSQGRSPLLSSPDFSSSPALFSVFLVFSSLSSAQNLPLFFLFIPSLAPQPRASFDFF